MAPITHILANTMIIHKTPFFLRIALPKYRWLVNTRAKDIFLTFDDGPVPGATEFVLDTLKQFNAQATFFCVGDNIAKHPHIFNRVVAEGHTIGNHTHNHLNGWKTSTDEYVANVYRCQQEISKLHQTKSRPLFRPPYGRILRKQAALLLPDFDIVMWDVLTADYNPTLSPQRCLRNAIVHTKPGSIVLFHDSIKAEKNLRYTLPQYLQYFKNQGFEFKSL